MQQERRTWQASYCRRHLSFNSFSKPIYIFWRSYICGFHLQGNFSHNHSCQTSWDCFWCGCKFSGMRDLTGHRDFCAWRFQQIYSCSYSWPLCTGSITNEQTMFWSGTAWAMEVVANVYCIGKAAALFARTYSICSTSLILSITPANISVLVRNKFRVV